MPLRRLAASLLAIALVAGACSKDEPKTRLTILAAASLTEAFGDIGEAFEKEHPDVDVQIDFGGTPDLVLQVEEGRTADLLASADVAHMDRLVANGSVQGEPVVFANNVLAIAVEPGNPEGIAGLSDLENEDLIVSMAAPEVPAGSYALAAIEQAGLAVEADSLEADVKAVIARVALGEADAGIVYATDVIAAGDEVEGVPLGIESGPVATYPAAVLTGSRNGSIARQFIDLLLSKDGVIVLQRHGFQAP